MRDWTWYFQAILDFVPFKDFQGLMESVMRFSLDPDYLKIIKKWRSFDSINSKFDVTEIPKPNIVLTQHNVPQFLAKTKRALREFSEQALEAVLSLFADVLKKYHMKNMSAANYNTRYYRVVMLTKSRIIIVSNKNLNTYSIYSDLVF